jgi:nucleolar protein 14
LCLEEADEYDVAVRDLAFDTRAYATDKLKTPQELAQLENERLQQLEKDRQRR